MSQKAGVSCLYTAFFLCVPCLVAVLTAGCGGSMFMPQLIGVAVNPQTAAIGTGQTMQFTAALPNDSTGVTWTATAGTIDGNGNYTAPAGPQSTTATVTATSKEDPTKSSSATINVVAPGRVSATANLQVALYAISPAAAGNVLVQFGLDTNYGLTTWAQPVPSGGGGVSLFVAGMKGNTLYHMRGVVQFSDGSQFVGADQTFTTGAVPPAQLPAITATTTAGMTPQSGVELLDLVGGAATISPLLVTDLSGNVLWSYNPGLATLIANPIKLLPNGHFLINFSGTSADGVTSVLQEVDLSGQLIWQMSATDLNNALAAATCGGDGCNITVLWTHHDFAILPNGHLIVIAATENTKIIPGATVIGDVIIDLDPNHKPVWLWNEFNHLDINRQPFQFPDWTHTNAVIYSADDANLIVSLRHQNWLVKVDYANGAGAGDIVWKLGYQGDFTLVGGTPTDWFYAQHAPSFTSTNTTGKFSLTLFDNGDDRVFPPGMTCGATGEPPCLYSTVPILDLDETAKTATLTFHPTTPTYSFFGGNSAVLRNRNVEYCESAGGPGLAGDIYEVTQDSSAQTVWQMLITGGYAYRGQRIPSFYPGVQW